MHVSTYNCDVLVTSGSSGNRKCMVPALEVDGKRAAIQIGDVTHDVCPKHAQLPFAELVQKLRS
jgi:hypothetical protein